MLLTLRRLAGAIALMLVLQPAIGLACQASCLAPDHAQPPADQPSCHQAARPSDVTIRGSVAGVQPLPSHPCDHDVLGEPARKLARADALHRPTAVDVTTADTADAAARVHLGGNGAVSSAGASGTGVLRI